MEVAFLLGSYRDAKCCRNVCQTFFDMHIGRKDVFLVSLEHEEGGIEALVARGVPITGGNGVVCACMCGKRCYVGGDKGYTTSGEPMLRHIAVAKVIIVLVVEGFQIRWHHGFAFVIGIRFKFWRFGISGRAASCLCSADAEIVKCNGTAGGKGGLQFKFKAIVSVLFGCKGEGAGSPFFKGLFFCLSAAE